MTMECGCRTSSELRKIDDGGRFNSLRCEIWPSRKPRSPRRRPLLIVVSDDTSLPLKKRIRLDNETTSNINPRELANLPRSTINPCTSSRDRVEPELLKKKERKKVIIVFDDRSLPLKKRIRLDNETTSNSSPRELANVHKSTINPCTTSRDRVEPELLKKKERKKAIIVSDDHSLPLKKRFRIRIRIRLDNETTSNSIPRELANLPRSTINPRASSRDRVEPELLKKKERKKAIKYSPEQVEQLKQKGMSLPLPEEVRVRLQELGGSANPVRLVIKHLFQTDLSEHHGRFNLPETKFVKADEGGGFLREEEWRALKNKETMKVRLVGPMCTEPTSMILKTWEMKSGSVPILTSGWAKFLKKYETEHKGELREGDGVQLWATRCDGNDLLLALQVIHRAPVVDDVE